MWTNDLEGIRSSHYGAPEIENVPPCRTCGSHRVFSALAKPGEREQPVFLRCCGCDGDRTDLDLIEETWPLAG
jgi:hypothetical protein